MMRGCPACQKLPTLLWEGPDSDLCAYRCLNTGCKTWPVPMPPYAAPDVAEKLWEICIENGVFVTTSPQPV